MALLYLEDEMFDYGIAAHGKPQHRVVDVDAKGWNLPYRVEFRVYGTGAVYIDKVEVFCEFFQIYKEITVDILPRGEEFKLLQDKLYDWNIGEQLFELDRAREKKKRFQTEDPNPAA